MSNIEVRRRQEVNTIKTEISSLEKAQIRDSDNLKKLAGMKINKEMLDKKKASLLADIERRTKQIEELKKKEENMSAGNLDKQLISEGKKNQVVHKAKTDAAIKKRNELLKEDRDKEVKMKVQKEVEKQQSFHARTDVSHFTYQFYKAIDSLPENKKRNLKEMPGNKGYIWHNCWFYGLLPPEPGQPNIMFENIPGDILIIHEFDSQDYNCYAKIGRERKTLLFSQTRGKGGKNWTWARKHFMQEN